jgi:HD-GYP domain-containing protein (c-di-GMP phosphodiesterase class II)
VGGPQGLGRVRLAEIVAALSLGVDLGFDQPMEHVLRQCLIALRLAERVGVEEDGRVAVYYTALLTNVGCHSDAHEQAKWFGDDILLKADKYTHAHHKLQGAVATLRQFGSGGGMAHRFRLGLEFAVSGHRDLSTMIEHHARMARRLGEDLGLAPETLAALDASYEQWDGRGYPGELGGDDVPLAARLALIGEFVEVAHRVGGIEGARALLRNGKGKEFDPYLADALVGEADLLLAELDTVDAWDAVIGSEPALAIVLTEDEVDAALLAVADFVDLKSPYSLGHARAVAELAAEAGRALGLPEGDVRLLRRAGLVHCFGKLGVSNAILDKRTPLTRGERERLHLVPYLTHRMLRQSPALRPVGDLAAQYAQRLDGSGHPAGLAGPAVSLPARVLAAAHAFQVLREPRADREPHPPREAATRLRADVRAGRLDGAAVEAVLSAAGQPGSRRVAGPAGLTAREVDVLSLVARGLTTKEIADRLVISRKTVANHVEHIYAKIGTSTRTAAALFATQHGLLVTPTASPPGSARALRSPGPSAPPG